jgi:hypothetical protein
MAHGSIDRAGSAERLHDLDCGRGTRESRLLNDHLPLLVDDLDVC